MTIRHLKLPLALAFALTASQAHALGLGQLQVKSGLGQPLVAEIPVLSATQAELDNFNVRLASPEAFARVGLDLPLSLSANLQMTLVKDARGLPVIRVTTPGRFNEPYLSFLVEADWGRGSLVREFTALVDPPFIAPAVIRPLQAPTVSVAVAPPAAMRPINVPPAQNPATIVQREPVAPDPVATPEPPPAVTSAPPPPPMPYAPPPEPVAVAPEPAVEFEASPFSQPLPELAAEPPAPPPAPAAVAPAPVRQQAPAPKPVAAAPPPAPKPVAAAPPPPAPPPASKPMAAPPAAPANDQYGPVKEGQTLWSLAESLRQDTSITVNQMMLAMQRANPGAFIDDNVNRLKSGAVLRIPAREESIAILPEEAAALIRQQSGMRPVPQPEQSVAREPAPKPAAAPAPPSAPAPAVTAPAKPAVAATRPRQGRLEIVPPAGKSGARSSQSGASASGGGTELRAELSQAKEDLAAREAEVVELKSRVTDLEKMQTDSKSLIEMQNSELKALRDRLAQIEKDQQAAASAPAPAPAAAAQAVAPANDASGTAATTDASTSPEAAAPWYQHPGTIGGAILFLSFIVWWLSRRGKGSEGPAPTRRISEDSALQASLAQASAASGEPVETDANEAAVDHEDFEKLGLEDMVNMNPRDLEAHLNLLRYLHRKGDASAFEAAATDMRGQLGNTTDPRWREVVVMGMGLLPGHPLFSQLGWNAPKFASSEPEPKAAPIAPSPAPESVEATPSWMRTTAPSQIPGNRPNEPAAFTDGDSYPGNDDGNPEEMDLTRFEHGSSPGDIHRQEAELQDADETSATKIELAKAYLDIGDIEGARAMLEDVLAEGGPEARTLAASILKELG